LSNFKFAFGQEFSIASGVNTSTNFVQDVFESSPSIGEKDVNDFSFFVCLVFGQKNLRLKACSCYPQSLDEFLQYSNGLGKNCTSGTCNTRPPIYGTDCPNTLQVFNALYESITGQEVNIDLNLEQTSSASSAARALIDQVENSKDEFFATKIGSDLIKFTSRNNDFFVTSDNGTIQLDHSLVGMQVDVECEEFIVSFSSTLDLSHDSITFEQNNVGLFFNGNLLTPKMLADSHVKFHCLKNHVNIVTNSESFLFELDPSLLFVVTFFSSSTSQDNAKLTISSATLAVIESTQEKIPLIFDKTLVHLKGNSTIVFLKEDGEEDLRMFFNNPATMEIDKSGVLTGGQYYLLSMPPTSFEYHNENGHTCVMEKVD
jgi:hypothetical protein